MKKLLKTRKWALWDLLYFFVEAFSSIINIDWDIILQKFLVRYHRKFTPVFCMSLAKFCQKIFISRTSFSFRWKCQQEIECCFLLRVFTWITTHTTTNFHFSEKHFCNVTLSVSSNPSYSKPILPHRRTALCLRFELGQTMSCLGM